MYQLRHFLTNSIIFWTITTEYDDKRHTSAKNDWEIFDFMAKETRDKLKSTPFESVEDLKEAQNRIRKEVWEDSMRALAQAELLEKDEFKKLEQNWKKPWKGFMKEKCDEIISFYLTEDGVPAFTISERLQDGAKGDGFVEGLIRGGFSVFTDSLLTFRKIRPVGTTANSVPKKKAHK